MTNDLLIYGENICAFPHIRKPFLIYDLAPDPTWISLYEENLVFFFISVNPISTAIDLATPPQTAFYRATCHVKEQ
jgi:hypothetical protein